MTDRLPLPNPWAYCYSFETITSQHLSFSANKYNGAPPSRSVPLYTADQMRQYADDANAALRERVKMLEDALRGTVRELQACQSVIHLAGGFDPAYVSDAQVALKSARAALEKTKP